MEKWLALIVITLFASIQLVAGQDQSSESAGMAPSFTPVTWEMAAKC